MRGGKRFFLAATCVVAFAASPVVADLQSTEAPDLRLVYLDPVQTPIAPYAARCFLNSMQFQRRLWDYEPSEPVTVFLADSSDQGNASAANVPRNSLIVDLAPLSLTYETVTPNERINWIMNHELVHIATGDRGSGSDKIFRKLFAGKVAPEAEHPETIFYFYLTTPRYAVPQWYREGIAVFVETWMAGGLGRAQGPWDEMVFRSKVRDGVRFHDPLGLVSEGVKSDFQAGVNYYLYGTRFMSYLAHEHTPESVIEWVSRRKGSKRYYAKQFRHVFGKRMAQAWQDWIEWEGQFQQRNLESIREYPLTDFEDLSPRALGSVSRAFVDPQGQRMYAALNYPGTVPHIGAISLEDGSIDRIVEVKGPTLYSVASLAYDPEAGTIFYTSDNMSYRDLRAVDLQTKKARVLLRDVRIGDLAFNAADRSLWGVRHYQGIATLVRIPPPYDRWNQVHSWPYGEVIHDLDVSPDGKLVSATVDEIDGRHILRVFETERLLVGDVVPIAKLDFGNTIPSNFVFSNDGRHLYGNSYYTGVSNIFRFEIASGEFEALTNTETGFFRPLPQDNGDLIVFRYTGKGFVPARIRTPESLEDLNAITYLGQQIAEKHPQVRDWTVGSPADVSLEDTVTFEGDYRSFKLFGLESVYPVVEGYKDFAAYGLSMNLSDPLSFNRATITTTYTPNSGLASDERLHVNLAYHRKSFKVGYRLNDADFYDLFGPTKRSRKGYVVDVAWDKNLILDTPRRLDLELGAAFYGDLEQLPRYQNVAATLQELTEVGGRLTYTNRRASLGAIDHERGVKAETLFGATIVEDDTIPQLLQSFDVGFELPLPNSSIWWRNAVGASFGEPDDPFASFYFGGFGNNYVDHLSVKRYREWYAFPGLELNELPGRNFARSMLEWNLPPLRFRRAGTPSFFLSWARTSLFVSGIETNLDDDLTERRVGNAGVQVDFRLTALARLNLTFSLGYAAAFEEGTDATDEFMWSLKILD